MLNYQNNFIVNQPDKHLIQVLQWIPPSADTDLYGHPHNMRKIVWYQIECILKLKKKKHIIWALSSVYVDNIYFIIALEYILLINTIRFCCIYKILFIKSIKNY
jgi:hypothetical protein|uniref:Uncharacterized protein n=1 Tax=Sipha flava TaxID=143950 RepID=A0A2S2R4E9_9HEMI